MFYKRSQHTFLNLGVTTNQRARLLVAVGGIFSKKFRSNLLITSSPYSLFSLDNCEQGQAQSQKQKDKSTSCLSLKQRLLSFDTTSLILTLIKVHNGILLNDKRSSQAFCYKRNILNAVEFPSEITTRGKFVDVVNNTVDIQ